MAKEKPKKIKKSFSKKRKRSDAIDNIHRDEFTQGYNSATEENRDFSIIFKDFQ